MPRLSKHLRPSKRRQMIGAGGTNGEKNEELRSKKKKTNNAGSSNEFGQSFGGVAPSSLQVSVNSRDGRGPSLAELERLFEGDSDVELQVITPCTYTNSNQVAFSANEAMHTPFHSDTYFREHGGAEVQVVINPNRDPPNESQMRYGGHKGPRPSLAELEEMFVDDMM